MYFCALKYFLLVISNFPMKSINFITLGCSKNNVDSEVLAAQYSKMGYQVVHESDRPGDIVVINTCCFINDAKEESIDTILTQLERKKAGIVKTVYVVGCLAQRYKEDLQQTLPEVDGFYNFAELHLMLKTDRFDLLEAHDRLLSTPKHYAYLKISEGCDRSCSYCAIPFIRGKQISKPIDLLVEEATRLADNGVKELMLIAQDLTWYGVDIYQSQQLEKLLRKIAQIDGLEWIRLHYAYPMGFPYEILEVMSEYSNICKYLDIPLQHINGDILKSMNRGGNSMQLYKLVETIRNKVPDIAIRTTLISGYPTETREQHKELVRFVEEMRFERLGVFSYSQEEGTPAFSLGDPIKVSEKNRRLEELMTLQEEISLALNEKRVGSAMRVMVDEEADNFYIGRTEFDSPEVDNEVLINKNELLTVGEFYPIQIEKADYFDLYGKKI
ncbi:MAG: 30S ribosomal protein S12 methylthiotransferase RimO [Bacteroidales bacterium]|jgi:ribosomal protein S12 methylthiotransferase|nr:30S ribosomal protein S12 methylthiotransferase RimO [Bacteroidales bacterium]